MADARWSWWQRFVLARHRHTPYRDVPRFSPYRVRYQQLLPELRVASHHPVIRAQVRDAEHLATPTRWLWWRISWLLFGLLAAQIVFTLAGALWGVFALVLLLAVIFMAWPWVTARDMAYCVDCHSEARRRRLLGGLRGPMQEQVCPGRSDGTAELTENLAAQV